MASSSTSESDSLPVSSACKAQSRAVDKIFVFGVLIWVPKATLLGVAGADTGFCEGGVQVFNRGA